MIFKGFWKSQNQSKQTFPWNLHNLIADSDSSPWIHVDSDFSLGLWGARLRGLVGSGRVGWV